MMPMNSRDRNAVINIAGWLFADLLLALAIFFVASNTLVVVPPPPPTPTPLPTLPPPTSTPLPCLLRQPVEVQFDIGTISGGRYSYSDLINKVPGALDLVEQQFTGNKALKGRRVGLVLPYGGTPNLDVTGPALESTRVIIDVMRQLGTQEIIFNGTVYHDPLLALGNTYNYTSLEMYLYAQSGQPCG